MKIFVSSRIVQFNHSSSRAEPCRNPSFYSILLLWFYLILPYSTWLKYLWKDPSKTSSKQLPQQVPNKKATNFPNMYCNKPLAVETKKNLHIVKFEWYINIDTLFSKLHSSQIRFPPFWSAPKELWKCCRSRSRSAQGDWGKPAFAPKDFLLVFGGHSLKRRLTWHMARLPGNSPKVAFKFWSFQNGLKNGSAYQSFQQGQTFDKVQAVDQWSLVSDCMILMLLASGKSRTK